VLSLMLVSRVSRIGESVWGQFFGKGVCVRMLKPEIKVGVDAYCKDKGRTNCFTDSKSEVFQKRIENDGRS
jgi:putative methionine-R-sulfoxide reductase with GAF domain